MNSVFIKSLLFKRCIQGLREFRQSAIRCKGDDVLSGQTHKVNNFERKLLVWTGRYKSAAEVPAYVSPEAMERTRSKMRIKVANYMMVLTALGCVLMIWSGKKAQKEGDTLSKRNLDFHAQYQADKQRQEELQKSDKV